MRQEGSIIEKTRKLVAVIGVAYITLSLGLCLCDTVNAAAGGISYLDTKIDDAVRGGTYNLTVMVTNSGDETCTFDLSAEGECSDWITTYNPENLTLGPITNITVVNDDMRPVLVVYDIPEDVANGSYTATVLVKSTLKAEAAEGGSGGGVAAALAQWPYKVAITVVGLQNLTGSVGNITVVATEVGYPLKAMVAFTNEGDVIATPVINISILKDGSLVGSTEMAETGIKPGSDGTITALCNTEGLDSGEYIANVTVSLDKEPLAKIELSFELLASGTLTRDGELKSLTYDGEPQVNSSITVLAKFENTGEIALKARFSASVLLDEEWLAGLTCEEQIVEVGENAEFVKDYLIKAPGEYLIAGYVVYDDIETPELEIEFTVEK
jgi:hypothetical protein